jgi:hypothetical protein
VSSVLAGPTEEVGLPDRVQLPGAIADVMAVLWAIDLLALPSRSEGFPSLHREAMACGMACGSETKAATKRPRGGDALMSRRCRGRPSTFETLLFSLHRVAQAPRPASLGSSGINPNRQTTRSSTNRTRGRVRYGHSPGPIP